MIHAIISILFYVLLAYYHVIAVARRLPANNNLKIKRQNVIFCILIPDEKDAAKNNNHEVVVR